MTLRAGACRPLPASVPEGWRSHPGYRTGPARLRGATTGPGCPHGQGPTPSTHGPLRAAGYGAAEAVAGTGGRHGCGRCAAGSDQRDHVCISARVRRGTSGRCALGRVHARLAARLGPSCPFHRFGSCGRLAQREDRGGGHRRREHPSIAWVGYAAFASHQARDLSPNRQLCHCQSRTIEADPRNTSVGLTSSRRSGLTPGRPPCHSSRPPIFAGLFRGVLSSAAWSCRPPQAAGRPVHGRRRRLGPIRPVVHRAPIDRVV